MFEFYELVVIPIILGIVEVFKRVGFPVKYSPLLSLALGLIFGVFYLDVLKEGIIVGLIIGLSATGLYSGSKNIKQGYIIKNKMNKTG